MMDSGPWRGQPPTQLKQAIRSEMPRHKVPGVPVTGFGGCVQMWSRGYAVTDCSSDRQVDSALVGNTTRIAPI